MGGGASRSSVMREFPVFGGGPARRSKCSGIPTRGLRREHQRNAGCAGLARFFFQAIPSRASIRETGTVRSDSRYGVSIRVLAEATFFSYFFHVSFLLFSGDGRNGLLAVHTTNGIKQVLRSC